MARNIPLLAVLALALAVSGRFLLAQTSPAVVPLKEASTDTAPPSKPDPNALVDALAALGGTHLQSIRYSGTGTIVTGAPSVSGGSPNAVKRFEVSIDYPSSAMQIDLGPDMAASPSAGTANSAQAHRIEAINGNSAWDVMVTIAPVAPASKKGHGKTADANPISIVEPPRPNPAAALLRRQAIWITPHGFLKAALANQPALRPAGAGTEVSFYAGTNRSVGFLNSKHQVERVRTWLRDPERGDMLLDATYTDYAVFESVSFPTRIRQLQNGQLMLDVTITAVQPNVPVHVPVPQGL